MHDDDLTLETADRLLALRPAADHRHAGVLALLEAAAAPPRPSELAGETDAVRTFRTAYRPRNRRRAGLVALAAALAMSVGGTAYAARTGNLPDRIQRQVEAVLPQRGESTTPAAPARSPAAPSTMPSPAGSTSPTRSPAELCRVWNDARGNPDAAQLSTAERRALAAAAKGETGITAYCRELLGPAASPKAPTVRPTRQDGGNGNPNGSKPPSKKPQR